MKTARARNKCYFLTFSGQFFTKNELSMKKSISLIIACVLVATMSLSAQDYKTSVGVRGGAPSGITGKYFFNKKAAVEGILSGYGGGFELYGLYEIHENAFDVPYLNWYYGFGGHIGFADADRRRPYYYYDGRGTGFGIGADGVFGLEYTLTDIPFTLGVDIKPALDLAPTVYFWMGGGISIRFYF